MLQKVIKESRPATLVVAFLSTSLGIITACREHYIFKNYLWDLWRIFLVLSAGLLLQSGVNLINNFFEEDVPEEIRKKRTAEFLGCKRTEDEVLIFKSGLLSIFITAVIGIYLSCSSGVQLLIIEFIGIFSAYAYAGKPFNYKRYGLGAIMSLIMMGPLMTYASFFVFSRSYSIKPVLFSFTMGLFIPAILLANEIRDYEEDKRRGVGTLTVRIGLPAGKIIYYLLIIFTYVNTLILVLFKYLPIASVIVVTTIPLLTKIPDLIKYEKNRLVPETAKIYLIFGIELLITLLI